MTDTKKVPDIRFKGFTEDWEQRKFGEVAVRESNCDISSVDMPCVEYEDVIANEGQLNKDISLKEVQKKGIIFDGSQVLYGKLRPYLHNWLNPDFIGIAVGDWWVLRPVELDKNFLYRIIQTQQFDDIANQSAGSKMPRADWNLIAETKFMIPSIIKEQAKIGEYFTHLDFLITLHQRKLESFEKLKKSLLQNMFPSEGSKIPSIRFKGFTEDWEQRKLGEIGEISTGSTPSTSNSAYYSEDGIPWVTPTDINELTISDTPRKLSEEGAKVGRVVPANTILCTCIASIGKNTLLTVKGSFNQQINSLTPYDENDAYFLLTESEIWSNIMKRMATSGTMQIVNKTEFSELKTMVPSLVEQQAIGTYFHNLDHLITLHQRKLESLEKMKKALLQKMFV